MDHRSRGAKSEPEEAALAAAVGIASTNRAWAEGRGEVGAEWRFRLEPPGEDIRPLVPDVAYVSYERERAYGDDELEAPVMMPEVAIEVRSPKDRQERIDHKIGVYLACGASLVVVVDPYQRRIDAYDSSGTIAFTGNDRFLHRTLSGLSFTLDELFAVLTRPH